MMRTQQYIPVDNVAPPKEWRPPRPRVDKWVEPAELCLAFLILPSQIVACLTQAIGPSSLLLCFFHVAILSIKNHESLARHALQHNRQIEGECLCRQVPTLPV